MPGEAKLLSGLGNNELQKLEDFVKNNGLRYRSLNSYLREYFGGKVYRVSVDGGFTCPVRDGTKGWRGCIFCNVKSFTPPYAERSKSISEQVRKGAEIVKKFKKAEKIIVYFQPYTNTYGEAEKLRKLYYEAIYSHPDVVGLFIGTRPDCLPDDVVDLLDEINSKTFLVVELGLQTANPRTLEIIKRGHTVDDFILATKKLHERGIRVLVHVIIGLPGDGRDDYIKTAELLSELQVFAVKVHPLHVVKFTELEVWYMQGKYTPLTLDEYVDYAVEFLEHLSPSILIARLTGEAPDKFLVAPDWCRNKFLVLNRIQKRLEELNTYQGRKFLGKFSACL